MKLPKMIISGGQTGADMGGLVGAKTCGIATGGCAPRGYRTEIGPRRSLKKFGLVAHRSPNYRFRTEENVQKADATIVFSVDRKSAGTVLTLSACRKFKKRVLLIDPFGVSVNEAVTEIKAFIGAFQPAVLNVAGNRESIAPGIADRVAKIIYGAFLEKRRL